MIYCKKSEDSARLVIFAQMEKDILKVKGRQVGYPFLLLFDCLISYYLQKKN